MSKDPLEGLGEGGCPSHGWASNRHLGRGLANPSIVSDPVAVLADEPVEEPDAALEPSEVIEEPETALATEDAPLDVAEEEKPV
jgi:hypothetical protein